MKPNLLPVTTGKVAGVTLTVTGPRAGGMSAAQSSDRTASTITHTLGHTNYVVTVQTTNMQTAFVVLEAAKFTVYLESGRFELFGNAPNTVIVKTPLSTQFDASYNFILVEQG